MKNLVKLPIYLLPLGLLALVGVISINLWSYSRFTGEIELGVISFIKVDDQRYQASFVQPDSSAKQYALAGDDWQLEVRLLKWQSWLTFLGEDPLYRLDRLNGRYQDIEQERSAERTTYSLSDNKGVDVFTLAASKNYLLGGVDAKYGSSVYLPMSDGARYKITLSAAGVIARPVNAIAEEAVKFW